MKLQRAKVTNFKCVLDSQWFSIDRLTCLVGKNESGKTALLEALQTLKPADPERRDLKDTDYPRLNWSEYQESGRTDVALHTEWTLDTNEIEHITELASCDVLNGTTVIVTKDYKNVIAWEIELDIQKCVSALLDGSGLPLEECEPLASASTTSKLFETLRALPEPTARQSTFLAELTQRFPKGGLTAEVRAYLSDQLPTFLYYSSYDRLPGQVALNELVAAQSAGTLDQYPGIKVFIALLTMVGTNPSAIQNITKSESLIAQLEAVENRLSKRIFKYWTQNRHLAVSFRFDEASPADPHPFNAGKVFRTRIRNNRHQVTIGLDERSSGFIWFFSFLVWFSVVQRQHGDNLIVLLDEPGLTLHARAQSDLLRFIKEELLQTYQVIYTTHSPFMIDSADLLSCRTVEDATGPDDEVLGTRVGDDILSTDSDTLFPLQAALGYDLTQTLFVGEHCLLVEGPSDLLYLQWFSAELTNQNRVSVDRRWTITPCGGIAKVSSFMSLFGGSSLHVAVLTDHSHGDRRKVNELRHSQILRDGHVLTADMFCGKTEADIEDILGRDMYIALVNAAYGLKGKHALPSKAPADVPVRVVEEVENHFRTLPNSVPEYDHYTPAKYLIESGSGPNLPGYAEALDRFEALSSAANKLLPRLRRR